MPPGWIWGAASFFDVNAGSPPTLGTRNAVLYVGGGRSADESTWTGTFFLQYKNPRTSNTEYFFRSGLSTSSNFQTEVCNVQAPAKRMDYLDRDGFWKVALSWTEIFRPDNDPGAGICSFDLSLDNVDDCTQAAVGSSRAMAKFATTENAILHLPIPFAKMDYAPVGQNASNEEGDTVHNFEALEASADLTIQYCKDEGGSVYKWHYERPPGASTEESTWAAGWPLHSRIATFEWSMFHGRNPDPEVMALRPTSQPSGTSSFDIDFSTKNIGGAPAPGVTVALKHYEFLAGTQQWGWDTEVDPAAGVQLKEGAWANGDDVLAGATYTYTPTAGRNSLGITGRNAGSMIISDGHGGQGAQTSSATIADLFKLCDAWKSVAATSAAQDRSDNNEALTLACSLESGVVGIAVNSASIQTANGQRSAAPVFPGGSSELALGFDPEEVSTYELRQQISQADYLGRDITGMDVSFTYSRDDTGYSEDGDVYLPALYSYDQNSESGIALWKDTAELGHDGTISERVAGSSGCYDANQNSYLRKMVDLNGASSASMSFWLWMDVQNAADYLAVEVSEDEQSWTTLETLSLDASLEEEGAGQWEQRVYDLGSAVGGMRYVQLRFVSDAATCGEGVFVDQWAVAVGGGDTSDADFELGDYDTNIVAVGSGAISTVESEEGYPSTALYTSFGAQIPAGLHLSDLRFAAEMPGDTLVHLQVRVGSTAEEMLQSDWVGPDGTQDSYFDCPCWRSLSAVADGSDRWIQYQVEFLSWDEGLTGTVFEVEWLALSGNTEGPPK